MTSIKSSELMDYLCEISIRSISGIIEWSQPHPFSFIWSKCLDGEEITVRIQKNAVPDRVLLNSYVGDLPKISTALEDDTSVETYLFQVQNKNLSSISLSLSSKDRPDLLEALANIFESAEKSTDRKAATVLKRLLMA